MKKVLYYNRILELFMQLESMAFNSLKEMEPNRAAKLNETSRWTHTRIVFYIENIHNPQQLQTSTFRCYNLLRFCSITETIHTFHLNHNENKPIS